MGITCKPCGKFGGLIKKVENKVNKEKSTEKKASFKKGKNKEEEV